MGKVAVLTVAFKEERFIRGCIDQFKPFNLHHLVLVSGKSWAGNEEPDFTATLARSTRADVDVIVSNWESEEKQRNFGQMMLKECDWILVVDADERYTPEAIEKWLKFLETADKPAYGMGRVITYWKDWGHCVSPEESPGLITTVKPSVKFTDLRMIDSEWANLPADIVCHHGSYIRTDEEMLRKIENFGHANEVGYDWYEKVWLKDRRENCHPVHPEIFASVVKCEKVVDD